MDLAVGGMVYAHSRNESGRRHGLADHLWDSTSLAGEFGRPAGLGEIARYVTFHHDAGKSSEGFQRGLLLAERTGGRVGLDHKSARGVVGGDRKSVV